ncbi:antitoxin Xre/MbcA/ParS toxin-binding domain-containing protein [Pleionea sediminis]|uniref:antitoxin Xre/MbcA/ParS toxin-binding domain-containing protein n=1 Tax=Pleionea sediminis TaxID=2569479 RepID=UPI0011859E8D|nr:antitoxin Xre/MbcA/ParS toxin-binding domain-containing protein [Pleionea sediminis]
MSASQHIQPEPAEVLGKALFSAADFLGLPAEVLGHIIGRDRTSISRLKKNPTIEPGSKTGELALLLIRVYRGLFAILGGNQAAMREWLFQNNKALDGRPIDIMKTVTGLTLTVQYIDAMRGKI